MVLTTVVEPEHALPLSTRYLQTGMLSRHLRVIPYCFVSGTGRLRSASLLEHSEKAVISFGVQKKMSNMPTDANGSLSLSTLAMRVVNMSLIHAYGQKSVGQSTNFFISGTVLFSSFT